MPPWFALFMIAVIAVPAFIVGATFGGLAVFLFLRWKRS
jgi:hypothetical protein